MGTTNGDRCQRTECSVSCLVWPLFINKSFRTVSVWEFASFTEAWNLVSATTFKFESQITREEKVVNTHLEVTPPHLGSPSESSDPTWSPFCLESCSRYLTTRRLEDHSSRLLQRPWPQGFAAIHYPNSFCRILCRLVPVFASLTIVNISLSLSST